MSFGCASSVQRFLVRTRHIKLVVRTTEVRFEELHREFSLLPTSPAELHRTTEVRFEELHRETALLPTSPAGAGKFSHPGWKIQVFRS